MHDEAIEHFLDEGLIERVIRPIKSGKEASVHLCRANPRTTGEELAALKIYHPLDRRDFRDESIYRDGEWIKERRIRVPLEKRTRFGREVQGGIWVSREWETLHTLFEAGAPVPRPIEATDRAILMSYVGDEDDAAPQLHRYRLSGHTEGEDLIEQCIRAVERMLFHDVVHGDLSPFNVLVWRGQIFVIDLPQAVDPKKNDMPSRSWRATSPASASTSLAAGSLGIPRRLRPTCGRRGRSPISSPRSCDRSSSLG